MSIPIQNLFYLLLYAWDELREISSLNAKVAGSTNLKQLLARVLISSMEDLLRRGSNRSYVYSEQESNSIRGKLDVSQTVKRVSMRRGQAVCSYDEYNTNSLENQILCATLHQLSLADELDPGVKVRCKTLLSRMPSTEILALHAHCFRQVQLHKNISHYRLPLNVCELLFSGAFVSEDNGTTNFSKFFRDEKQMHRVFELFLYNFYRTHGSYSVSRPYLTWQADILSEDAGKYLPIMKTDMSLLSDKRKILVDAKYYRETLQSREGAGKIHSENLYQILSYLQSQEMGADATWEGMLIYPATTELPTLKYRLLGRVVTIATVNLNQPWERIHEDLLKLVA